MGKQKNNFLTDFDFCFSKAAHTHFQKIQNIYH